MTPDLTLAPALPAQGALSSTEFDVIAIGGGPAGATSALYTARAGLRTLVIDKGLTAGALGLTSRIANFPGIPGEVGGAELVGLIRQQAESFGAIFVQDKVQSVDLSPAKKLIYTNKGTYSAPVVIIATGSMGRAHRVKGEDGLVGRGVSYCATCDGAFFQDREVAVIGNDEEAVEAALFLTRFASRIHVFSPTRELKTADDATAHLVAHPKIDITLGAALREVRGDGQVEAIVVAPRGEPARTVPVSGVFIFLQGNQPVTDFLQGQIGNSPTECLRVDDQFHTDLSGVFAVGDVVCNHVKQAVVAAAEGAVAAIAAEKLLRGRQGLCVDWAK